MIGGMDIIIPVGEARFSAFDLCLKAMKVFWPNAIYEDSNTGEIFDTYELIGEKKKEYFVHKDSHSKEEWDKDIPETENTMIYFILGETEITFVVDTKNAPEMKKILNSFQKIITDCQTNSI